VTIALIAANVSLFFGVLDPLDYAMRTADPDLWIWTNFSSLFMHLDEEHLWGNMLFLWAFGSALEPRIGRWRYLAWYFVAGSAGNVLSTFFYLCLAGNDRAVALGASGAIAGVMGLFVVRCYFTRVGLPVPVFGALGAALPAVYRVHVNALVLVGLYFCLDLLGARSEIAGEGTGIDHLAHLGGYCMGLCIGFGSGLVREGRRELLELRASRPLDPDGFGPDASARDRVLERCPDHLALRIARARARSKYVARNDGREDYEVAIRLLGKRDPTEAARIFAEFFGRYGIPLPPREQLLLTPALERLGRLDLAARALELAAESPGIEALDHEHALLRQARLLEAMGLPEPAIHVYEKLLQEHPGSRAIVEAKLARCRAAVGGAGPARPSR
jgi:membrane associated rhomboid family serine protease